MNIREQLRVKKELFDLNNKKILVIEDNVEQQTLIHTVLSRSNAQLYQAFNGQEGLRLFYAERPDLVILDLMMPKMDGWEVCRKIRHFSDVPIIMLTALNSDKNIIRGSNYGADDYLTKPIIPNVLLGRVQEALRRSTVTSDADDPDYYYYSDDHLKIDIRKHQVVVQGKPVKLTAKEYQVLAYLFQNSAQVVTLQQILEKVWGQEYRDSGYYVHINISHLRRKLEPDPKRPRYLLTEQRSGYRFMKLAH